jgi:hypothetical protein
MCWCEASSNHTPTRRAQSFIICTCLGCPWQFERKRYRTARWNIAALLICFCVLQEAILRRQTPMAKPRGKRAEKKLLVKTWFTAIKASIRSETQPVSTEAISTRVTAYHAELVESLFACSGPAANVPLLSSKDVPVAHTAFRAAVGPPAITPSL